MTTLVTRNGQITLDVEVRRQLGIITGTPLEVHRIGEMIIIRKRDPTVFKRCAGFLPENFPRVLKK